ncbi:MAG: SpoIID/LytB domain-containing protein [Elusimicrobia bacterium]|nr:SpoIID/LytB domain-containing protein [Elusimicrobiota bacterium]
MQTRVMLWIIALLVNLPAAPVCAANDHGPDVSTSAFSQAHALYYQGKLKEAMAAYARLFKNEKTAAEAYKNAAIVSRDMGDVKKAAKFLSKAKRLAPGDQELAAELAWFYYLSGKTAKAEKEARHALSLTSNSNTPAQFTLGLCLRDHKKYSKAVPVFAAMIEEEPLFLPAYMALGKLYERTGDWAKALENYHKAVDLDHTYLEGRLAAAEAQEKLGHPKEALRFCQKVLKFDPDQPKALQLCSAILQSKALASAKEVKGQAREEVDKIQEIAARRTTPKPQIPLTKKRKLTPRLRVGLATTSAGNPLAQRRIKFAGRGPFKIYRKDDKKIVARGLADQTWIVETSTQGGAPLKIKLQAGNSEKIFNEPLVIETDRSTNTIVIQQMPFGHGFAWSGAADREYRGRIELIPDSDKGMIIVNDIILEEYLYSVLAGETPVNFPPQALKAQAVIARSAALYRTQLESVHSRHPYDLCDGQHCQVYTGVSEEHAKSRRAVSETRGIVLTYKSKIINALFHANCGGWTQTAADLSGWSGEPYLQSAPEGDFPPPQSPWETELWIKGRPEAFCRPSDSVAPLSFRWAVVTGTDDLEERLNRSGNIGKLKKIIQLKRGPAGYLHGLKFIGIAGEKTVRREHQIRRLLAVGHVKSPMLVLDARLGKRGRPDEIYIFGAGWGHGVGLCQGGAANLAALKKWNYEQILRHYYTDIRFETLKWGR